jgi:formylglycine-generating enzyme required for sulfatase activity
MAAALRPLSSWLGTLIAILILTACAPPPAPPKPPAEAQATAPEEIPQQTEITTLQLALNAIEEQNYPQALKHFRSSLKERPLNDAVLYAYGKALYETGNFSAAVEAYSAYIDKLGRRGDNFLAALEERQAAEQKLQQQQAEAEKKAQAAEVLKNISASLEANWLVVHVQMTNLVGSFTEPMTGIEMLLVRGGCYQRSNQQVCVDDFYLSKYEITQQQWQQVMGYNPAQSGQGPNHPVDSVSWTEASEFARRLGGSVGQYRLPTEAEWEYAARSGGKPHTYSGGSQLEQLAWYEENTKSSQPVGLKKANQLGFFDMSGNVYEWCLDALQPADNAADQQNDTIERVRRGGSWASRAAYQRIDYRASGAQDSYRDSDTGFRLAVSAPTNLPATQNN